jgi:adenylosuccinate lyase
MRENLAALGGVVHSQKVLLALTQAGMPREAAYAAVQRAAMATWEGLDRPGARDFRAALLADAEVAARLGAAGVDAALDATRDFVNVPAILDRALADPA